MRWIELKNFKSHKISTKSLVTQSSKHPLHSYGKNLWWKLANQGASSCVPGLEASAAWWEEELLSAGTQNLNTIYSEERAQIYLCLLNSLTRGQFADLRWRVWLSRFQKSEKQPLPFNIYQTKSIQKGYGVQANTLHTSHISGVYLILRNKKSYFVLDSDYWMILLAKVCRWI